MLAIASVSDGSEVSERECDGDAAGLPPCLLARFVMHLGGGQQRQRQQLSSVAYEAGHEAHDAMIPWLSGTVVRPP